MRALLDERGLSYRALAARTFHGKSYLQELAAGKKTPTVEVARRIDQALDAGGELVARAAGEVTEPDRLDCLDWRRRENERRADARLAQTPGPDNALTLAHEGLIAEPPQVYELRAERRIGDDTVRQVEERVHQLRLLDDHVGGSRTYAIVTG